MFPRGRQYLQMWPTAKKESHTKETFAMKRLWSLALLLFIFAPPVSAQSGEYKRWEFFGGYSALSFDNLGDDTDNAVINDVLGEKNTLRGFNLAVTHNFHKYFGAKFDYSLHLREDNFSRLAGSGTIDTTVHNFLGGIQIKNNTEDGPVFKPFAHALFGVANQKIDLDSPQLPAVFGISDFSINETSFAMALDRKSTRLNSSHLVISYAVFCLKKKT